LSAAEEIRLTDQQTWLHETSFWIQAPDASEVRVKFSGKIEQISVLMDQRIHSAWYLTATELVLPLEASTRPTYIQVRCRNAHDTLERPTLAGLQIAQAQLETPERVVWLPLGMFPSGPALQPSGSLLPRLLHQAEAQMQITAALTQDSTGTPAATRLLVLDHQRNFYACVWQAEYVMSILKGSAKDSDQASWRRRISELKARNAALAKECHYEGQREAAERMAKAAPWLPSETDRFYTGLPVVLPAEPSGLCLQFDQARFFAEHREQSELILLVAIFLLVFSFFRRGFSILSLFAPEVVAGLVAGAMWYWGAGLIGVLLFAALLSVRVFWIVKALQRRWRLLSTEFEVSQLSSAKIRPPQTPTA
jgi:hypothetical protein